MHNFSDRVSERLRSLERPIEAFSQVLWPYPESKLIFYVSILAVLDYVSTFIVLELSGNSQISEIGLLEKWTLQTGEFPRLLLMDMVSIFTLDYLGYWYKIPIHKAGLQWIRSCRFCPSIDSIFCSYLGGCC
jgi:hypothetical protein